MHRPGIARVLNSKIILDGTTIEEVKEYHRDTLVLCVKTANEAEATELDRQRVLQERRRQQTEAHRKSIENTAGDISFD